MEEVERRQVHRISCPLWAVGGFIGGLVAGVSAWGSAIVAAFVFAVGVMIIWAIVRSTSRWRDRSSGSVRQVP